MKFPKVNSASYYTDNINLILKKMEGRLIDPNFQLSEEEEFKLRAFELICKS